MKVMQSKKYLSLQLSSVFDSATRAGQSSFGTFFGVEGKRILHSHVGFSARGKLDLKAWAPAILKMKQLDRETCAFSKFDLDVF